MAFIPYSYDDGMPRPFEYHVLAEECDIEIGLAMSLTGSGLVVSDEPELICMREERNVPAGTRNIPTIRVSGDVVWEAPLFVSSTSLAPGSLAGVSKDGLFVDPAAVLKNIQIEDMDGTNAGDKCRCRFFDRRADND